MLPLGTRRPKLGRERIIAASGPGLAVFTAHQMLSLTCSSSSSTLRPWGLDPGELFCKGLCRVPSHQRWLNKDPRWELLRKAETICSCPAKCIIPGLKRIFPTPFIACLWSLNKLGKVTAWKVCLWEEDIRYLEIQDANSCEPHSSFYTCLGNRPCKQTEAGSVERLSRKQAAAQKVKVGMSKLLWLHCIPYQPWSSSNVRNVKLCLRN